MVTMGSTVAFVGPDMFPAAGVTSELTLDADGPFEFEALASVEDGVLALRIDQRAGRYELEHRSVTGSVLTTARLPQLPVTTRPTAIASNGEAVLIGFGTMLLRVVGEVVQELTPPGASIRNELLLLPGRSRAMAAWIDDRLARNGNERKGLQVFAAPVASAAWNAGGTLVSRSARRQSQPVLAAGGGTIVAAWVETGALPARLAVQFLAPDGRPLRAPLHFPGGSIHGRPLAGFDGSDFLVIWPESTQPSYGVPPPVRGVRIAPDGKVWTEPFVIPGANGHEPLVSLSWNGSTWDLATPRQLFTLRADGSVAERRDLPLWIDSTQYAHGVRLQPRAGNSWLGLAWVTYFIGIGSVPVPSRWWLVRVDPDLRRASEAIELGIVQDGPWAPSVAWNGERGLAVWWNGSDVWQSLALTRDPADRIVPAGGMVTLPYTRLPGDAQVVATERSFLACGGATIALHALDGALLALHPLPHGAFAPRLLALGDREALVVYVEQAYVAPGRTVDGVIAERVVFSPKRRAAR